MYFYIIKTRLTLCLIHPGGERCTARVKFLPQQHNTKSPARARTQTARSGVKRTQTMRPPGLQCINPYVLLFILCHFSGLKSSSPSEMPKKSNPSSSNSSTLDSNENNIHGKELRMKERQHCEEETLKVVI